MVSHYYELTGRSRQLVEGLEKLYHVRECMDPVRINSIEQVAKKFLSFLLFIPVLPLTLLAHVVQVLVREEIPTEIFEQERKKWNEISCSSKPELYHQTIIKKLIASRIDPANYAKFLVVEYNGDRTGGGYFCGLDGLYRSEGAELIRAFESHKEVLICVKIDISFWMDFYEKIPNYPKLKKHIADNLLEHSGVSLAPTDFQQSIDHGLDVLFFDQVSGIDFSKQVSLAVSHRMQIPGPSHVN